MTRSESETFIAVALWQAGRLTDEQCQFWVERAVMLPDFRCQDIRNWKQPPARSVCDCGNEMKNQFGPCAQCEEEHAAIYQPNGRRRILGPNDYD
jgi:hypothetical protein